MGSQSRAMQGLALLSIAIILSQTSAGYLPSLVVSQQTKASWPRNLTNHLRSDVSQQPTVIRDKTSVLREFLHHLKEEINLRNKAGAYEEEENEQFRRDQRAKFKFVRLI